MIHLIFFIALISFALLGMIFIEIHKHKESKKAFGDAHWASMREIKKMGLLDNKDGLIIGEKCGRLLRAPLISHALIFAPSRSGKGVSQVIPIALTYPESILIVDIKDEIFLASSGFRQKSGQAVFSFAPARSNNQTHRWNPLDLIDQNSSRLIADIDLICQTLISYSADKDSMWVEEARTLLKGLLLCLMTSGRPFHFGELVNFVKGTPDFVKELTNIRNNAINEDGTLNIHPIAFTNINNFIEKAYKEQSGVKSTLTAKLNLWDDPLIQAATETSDFDIRNMRRKKMTVYLGIPVDQLDRLAPLMNLFIQLFLNSMTKELPRKDETNKVLVVVDEFCALGKMSILKSGFGFLAGFKNFKDSTLSQRQTGSSQAYISKPLISPNQVGNFSTKHGIAIFNGQPPIKYQRIIYYKDNRFKSRILPPINITKIEPHYFPLRLKKSQLTQQNSINTEHAKITQTILPLVEREIGRVVGERSEMQRCEA